MFRIFFDLGRDKPKNGWFFYVASAIFYLLLIAHVVECFIFREKILKSSDSPFVGFMMTLLFGYLLFILWDTNVLSSDILIGCKLAYLMPRQIRGSSVICCLVGNIANSGILMLRSFEYPPQGKVSCV